MDSQENKSKLQTIKWFTILILIIAVSLILTITNDEKVENVNINLYSKKSNKSEVEERGQEAISVLVNNFSSKRLGKSISLGKEHFGYTSFFEKENQIYSYLKDIYIDKLKINEDDILEIEIDGKIKVKEEIVDDSKIISAKSIAEKIANGGDKNKYLNIELKCSSNYIKEVEPNKKIIKTDRLITGEEEIVEGKSRKYKVESEVTYRNGKKVNEDIIDKRLIEKGKDIIIYKGTKDPIKNNIAFLNPPTRGGVITSAFGDRWGGIHNGIDIAGKIGDTVKAAQDGIVEVTFFERYGYGNAIYINHDNEIQTRYGHLSKILVKSGQKIKKGDVIGLVGNTGNSTGPHLHFEVRVDGQPVDPEPYIK